MYVGYTRLINNTVERVFHSTPATREEAHTAAVALADSLVGTENILEVERGYQLNENTFRPYVVYNVPPTDEQRNPS